MSVDGPAKIRALVERFGAGTGADGSDGLEALVAGVLDTLPPAADMLPSETSVGEDRAVRASTSEDDPLNAVMSWCSVRGTESGILDGLRVSVKDSIAVAGVPQTGGFSALRDFVPARDAVVVERLVGAGAEIVASTTMDCLGWAAGGETSGFGVTRNPHDPTRTAGGSSSGAAAGLSYAAIDAAIGCDQGGSIRVPASWCGVLGLKPTHGLVPYTGIMGIDEGIDHVGPLARTITHLGDLMAVLAGPDGEDPRQRDVSVEDFSSAARTSRRDLTGLRVGRLAQGFDTGPGPEHADTRRAVDDALATMLSLGAEIVDVSVPVHQDVGGVGFLTFLEGMADLYGSGGQGHGSTTRYDPALAQAFGAAIRDHADQLSVQAQVALVLGTYLTERHHGALYGAAKNRVRALRAAYDATLEEVDVLAMPTTPFTAMAVLDDPAPSTLMERGWSMIGNTSPFNVTGHPAISLPLTQVGAMPVGTMLVGRHGRDSRLVEIAAVLEQRVGWSPPIDLD